MAVGGSECPAREAAVTMHGTFGTNRMTDADYEIIEATLGLPIETLKREAREAA
jgi:hypothetical protein